MNFFYKSFLSIKNDNFSTIAFLIFLLLGISSMVLSLCFFPTHSIEEEVLFKESILNLIGYLIFTYISYFFFNFHELYRYKDTLNIKKKILEEEENILFSWTYTENEWSRFSEQYKIKLNKNKKIKTISVIVISLVLFTLFFLYSSPVISVLFFTVIFLLMLFNCKDFSNEDWTKILNKKKVVIIISELGYVVSNTYASPFNIDKVEKKDLLK
ncbi:hypothetical protein PG911_01665 [Tenacibaculum ovolyticum]|uniref:hypothetical protein n=1 Tax=Tenacibaculum ovolyticum TaxID=104270 RepID=UPI0022F3FDBA|nr:hypothetical protein [Tenacibaculum ovolyticum]WBX76993.1 hypothetical protein PG911_01665 [Tenacibaculum ovolyticum]